MAKFPFETSPAFEKLGEDTRKAVTQAFDAMNQWRNQMAELGERNSNAVFDKLAEAAKSLGWPTDFVELSRKQMMSASQMQMQAIDQMVDVWEKQIATIGKMPQMPNFPSFPGMPQAGQGGSVPGFGDMGSAPMMPMQLWMQAAEMWQKSWQQTVSSWMEAQAKAMNKPGSGGSKY